MYSGWTRTANKQPDQMCSPLLKEYAHNVDSHETSIVSVPQAPHDHGMHHTKTAHTPTTAPQRPAPQEFYSSCTGIVPDLCSNCTRVGRICNLCVPCVCCAWPVCAPCSERYPL